MQAQAGRPGGDGEREVAVALRAGVLQSHALFTGPAAVASVLVALLALAMLFPVLPPAALYVWLAALAVAVSLRVVLARRFRSVQQTTDPAGWLWRFRFGALLHGLAWGAAGWLPLPGADAGLIVSLTLLLGGLAAGTLVLTLFDITAGLLFAVPMMLPLALRLATGGAPVPAVVGAAGLVVVGVGVLAVFAAQRQRRERLVLAAARRAEAAGIEAVRRSEEQLRLAGELLAQKSHVLEMTLEALSQGVLSLDAGGRTTAYNARLLELLDLPAELMRQRPTLDELTCYQVAHGHFGAGLQALDVPGRALLQRYLDGDRRSIAAHYHREKRDGTVLEVRSHFASDGSLVRTFTDVTEAVKAALALRESEARFRTMADGAPALIWLSDAGGRQTWFNQRWLDVRGVSMEQELAAGWPDRVHPDDVARCSGAFTAAFAQRRRYEVEFRLRLAGGGWGWIADTGMPRFDPSGRFEGFIDHGWEIDERKAAEAALITARDEAERANRAKSEFLSRMSHELRTPMNAILGFGQLLESDADDPLTPGQRARVQLILRGGRQLLALIDEVLDLARIESGALELKLEAVELAALVGDTLRLVQPVAAASGIVLEAQPGAFDGLHVRADRQRLEQVLLNLLSNAIKYNRPGGRVGIAGRAGEGRIVVEVSDEGPGISASNQKRLFQAFERLDAERSAVDGTGIGLALSKWLVDLMEGEIGVTSEPGAGSTFWVRLATARDAAAAPAGGTEPMAAPPASTADRHVLYIEDNAVNQVLMEGMLALRPGIRLRLADEPVAGLAIAQASPPDLVLLDIQLPGMDGFEVLRRLRAGHRTADVPVIAVSANAMPDDIATARSAGFDDYLTKPVDLQRLLALVDQRLGTG